MSEDTAAPEVRSSGETGDGHSRFSPAEWKLLGAAGGVLATAAAIVQIAGTNGESPARSITLAAVTIGFGIPLLVGVTRLVNARHHKINISALLAAGVVIATGLAGGTAGYLIAVTGEAGRPASAPKPPAPATSPVTAGSAGPATSSPSPRPAPTRGFHIEITDNEQGTPVFSNPGGAAVAQNGIIPFNRRVLVKCWTPNESTMSSVNAFYLIETPPWSGDYAPANTFANGDPVGQPGSTTIDPAVPECRSS
jgi:hypothetical protein